MSATPLQILLAEDNRADQRLISEALSIHELEHRLLLIENGAEALDVVRKAGTGDGVPCPDLFILDMHLPCVDGLEVLSAFRQNENCAHTPVLVFSSTKNPQEISAAERFSGVQFIVKPTDLDEFLAVGETIKATLQKRAAG